jgi:hypothetical protein
MKRRNFLILGILGIGLLVVLYLLFFAEGTAKPITISRETTYFTEPVDEEGYVDLEQALNNLLRGNSTPETNANVLLWQAMGPTPEGGRGMHPDYWKALGSNPPPLGAATEYAIHAEKYLPAPVPPDPDELENRADITERLAYTPWKPQAYPPYFKWIAANDKAIQLTIQASKKRHYFNPLVSRSWVNGEKKLLLGALIPNVQSQRLLGQLVAARAMMKLGQGDHTGAWEDLLSLQRLAVLTENSGCLVELMVSIALETISMRAQQTFLDHTNLTAEAYLKCREDLEKLPKRGSMLIPMRVGSQVMFLDVCFAYHSGKIFNDDLLKLGPMKLKPSKRKYQSKFDWDQILKYANTWFDRLEEATKHATPRDRLEAFTAIEYDAKQVLLKFEDFQEIGKELKATKFWESRETSSDRLGKKLLGFLFSAGLNVEVAYDRTLQLRENLRLACALKAYQAEKKQYPETLVELVPRYIPAVPNDLFTGAALRYLRNGPGITLYSVGPNRTDDAGRNLWDNAEPGELDTNRDDITIHLDR